MVDVTDRRVWLESHATHTQLVDLVMALETDLAGNHARTQVLAEATLWAFEFCYHRDLSNAKLHCAPVRFSPLTERLAGALSTGLGLMQITEELEQVLAQHEQDDDDG